MSAPDEAVDALLGNLTDREVVGQLVMGHPQYLTPAEREALFGEYQVGSAIVREPTNPAYAAGFTNELQAYASDTATGVPLLLGGDFAAGPAGGVPLITHDPPFAGYEEPLGQGTTAFPQPMALGATQRTADAETVGRITARELRAMGYHWNFAPTADVNTAPENPVIGVRSFGDDPELVADFAEANIRGAQELPRDERVIATAKHFPGHGDTLADSHFDLPVSAADHETLESVHLEPFRAAFDAGVEAVMPAHVIYEALDSERIATLSPTILDGLLRDELGFEGLVVSDSMAMDAIEERFSRGEAAVEAVRAGVDVVITVAIGEGAFEKQVETVDGLYDAYRSGDLPAERVENAARRVLRAKFDCGLLDDTPRVDPIAATRSVGTNEHHESAASIGRQSMTVLENDGVLPFDPDETATTLVAGCTPALGRLRWAVENEGTGDVVRWRPASLDPTDEEIERVVALAGTADRAVLATWSGRGAPTLADGQVTLVRRVAETDTPTVAIAQELPYDAGAYAGVDAVVCAYAGHHGPKARHLRAAVEVLFGAEPEGQLPVAIDGYDYGAGLSYE
jgi:beta-N-acetylhexosaminidase